MNTQERIRTIAVLAGLAALGAHTAGSAQISPGIDGSAAFEQRFSSSWPNTDFSSVNISADEILSGGPPKDGIPSIDNPEFVRLDNGVAPGWALRLDDEEPVISIEIGGDARAYPLRILIWHEIVNDEVGTRPVSVTYCPLCNTSIVFDRRLEGRVLDFGTTGLLRHSDLVMYDRQTESWWQQFTGTAIAGSWQGRKLEIVPSRLESFARFSERHPEGQILVPEDTGARQYGMNPYRGYDSAQTPMFLTGEVDTHPLATMDRLVVFERNARPVAIALDFLRAAGSIEKNDVTITWLAGQTSALDARTIAAGKDVGNVIVQESVGTPQGSGNKTVDIPYQVTFAFAYRSFFPDGVIINSQTDLARFE